MRQHIAPDVIDASVTATDTATGEVVRSVTTGPFSGSFRLNGLDPDACYIVTVTKPGFVPTLRQVGDQPALYSELKPDGTTDEICPAERLEIRAGLIRENQT